MVKEHKGDLSRPAEEPAMGPEEGPKVGIGVVVWRDDKVLLIKRGKAPRKGEWSIPGGSQLLGETVFEAGRREVKEETGLDVEILGLVDVVDGIFRDEKGRLTNHYTLVDLVACSGTGTAVAADDATDAAWFRMDDLPALGLWGETLRIIRDSLKIIQARS